MILWIFQKSVRFQPSNNSLRKVESSGSSRQLGVKEGHCDRGIRVGYECTFLLIKVQTDSKLTLNWEEIKLGSLKSNCKSILVLAQ